MQLLTTTIRRHMKLMCTGMCSGMQLLTTTIRIFLVSPLESYANVVVLSLLARHKTSSANNRALYTKPSVFVTTTAMAVVLHV